MADAAASKAAGGNPMGVRVSPRASRRESVAPRTHADALKANGPNAWFAILHLAFAFIESNEVYQRGEDSNQRSRDFFGGGFGRIFRIEPAQPGEVIDAVANELYDQARCGLTHTLMTRRRVVLGTEPAPLSVVHNRDTGEVEQIRINADRFISDVITHFRDYVRRLRARADAAQCANFEKAWHLLHAR